MATAEEPHPEPEASTFADAADLRARERSRKQRVLLSAGGAVATTILWVWWFEGSREEARHWGALADATAWGRGVAVLPLAVFAALVASAFPRRTWFRFFAAYAVAMTFGLVMAVQASRLGRGNRATVSREELDDVDLRRRQLLLRQDYEHYSAALAKSPPFSAPALQSVEALDASVRRLDNLINIVDLMKKLTVEIEAKQPAGTPRQAREIRQLLDARKQDFQLSRATLALLTSNFGEWAYTDRGIVCDDPALQRRLEASVVQAADVTQRIQQLEARVATSATPSRFPQGPPAETTSKR